MAEMITGAVIAIVFFFTGVYIGLTTRYVVPKEQVDKQTEPKKDLADIFRTKKGLLSYKKYISNK